MAMTVGSVLFILGVAVLASLGLVYDFGDAATNVLAGFVASVFWVVGGLSAFSAYSQAWTGSRELAPVAYLAIGMGLLTAALALYQLTVAVRRSAGTTEGAPGTLR
jgi:hypothetical protein